MNLTACPVCGSTKFNEVLEAKDHLVSRETFKIVECADCTLRFTNPRPDNQDLGSYYKSDEYISHTNEGNNLVNRVYKMARYFTLRSKEKLIGKESKLKRLLDVGAGTGHFINHCQKQGWVTIGIEPDDQAREIALEQTKQSIYATLEDVTDKGFDRITLWHVLEHLPDLNNSLGKIKNLLDEQGKLFIAVPNYLAYEETKFKDNWAAYDVPRHLYHFTPEAMQILASNNGLKIDETYPMWLDSFYISLLSNKQKFNKNKYLNSFLTGLLSNIYAKKSGNFSSLIYKLSIAN